MDIEEIAKQIVDSAFQVHSTLGSGLLESAYQACLKYELEKRDIQCLTEVPQPIVYNGHTIEVGYRIDMLVENVIIIENKCVDQILPIHFTQTLTYMKLRGITLGFVINWKVKLIKYGIKRLALDHPESNWYLTRPGVKTPKNINIT